MCCGCWRSNCLQYFSGFFLVVQNDIELGEIEIGLVEAGSDLDARLELLLCLGVVRLADEENAQIIECLGIIRA